MVIGIGKINPMQMRQRKLEPWEQDHVSCIVLHYQGTNFESFHAAIQEMTKFECTEDELRNMLYQLTSKPAHPDNFYLHWRNLLRVGMDMREEMAKRVHFKLYESIIKIVKMKWAASQQGGCVVDLRQLPGIAFGSEPRERTLENQLIGDNENQSLVLYESMTAEERTEHELKKLGVKKGKGRAPR